MTNKDLEKRKIEIAATLKERREKLGLTQQTVADLTGITRKTINTIEAGLFFPSVENLLRLCYSLSITIKL